MAEKDQLELTFETSRLFDFYAALLSPKQNEALDYYYNEDLTLAEIASLMKVSRQAVHEQIRHGTQALLAFETKLQLIERFTALNAAVKKLETEIVNPSAAVVETLNEIKTLI